MRDYKKLKSGSDIRGTALGGEVDLTDKAAGDIADAFAAWLEERLGKKPLKIAVGHDSRLSAERLKKAVLDRLIMAGVRVYGCGLCSTPAMYMMTRYNETDCDAAIMITASHHPKDKNGLKFFVKSGGLEGADIARILELAESGASVENAGGALERGDYLGLYCNDLIGKVRGATGRTTPLEGLKIAVDAGNGAGGFFAERVLEPLGADISGSQFLEPDGNFPNHVPNPEDTAAMRSISERVKAAGADLGIIFDTDVDRAAIVSRDGEEINRNKLIALISAILLEEEKGCTVVTDSVTSEGLREFIEARGGVHHRFKRGYRNVINEAVRLNKAGQNAPLAIETSGHAALRENYFLDDGAYLVTRILIKMSQLKAEGRELAGLIAGLKVPSEEAEARLKLECGNWQEVGKAVIDKLAAYAKQNLVIATANYEGVRATVSQAQGWFLARMSVHDPIMVVNVESDVKGGVKNIAKLLLEALSEFKSKINLEQLKTIN